VTVNRKKLLTWLKPELDEVHAEGAAQLLDAVATYLEDAGPTRLLDDPPAFSFDPEAASSFLPDPVALPAATKGATRAAVDETEPEWLDPAALAAAFTSGALDRRQTLERFADRIAEWEPVLNAFTIVTLDKEADCDGALGGVPIGVQDMIGTAGVPTRAGSRLIDGYVPARDATSWARLAREGAVLAGKLATQEFAAGTTGENEWFGPVRNPWDPSRLAGGAASGPGAAVAAGLVSGAIATDPGGSIRVPAALCGVVGFKPTHGTVDRTGSIPLTWTTETLGALARTVPAAAQLADILLDGRARAHYRRSCVDAAVSGAATGALHLRIGVPEGWLAMGLDPDVDAAYRTALDALTSLGATLVEIELPDAGRIAPAHRAIAFSEASAIHEELILTRADGYGEVIRDRQEAGRGMLASEYLKAWRLRGQFARQFSEAWRHVDVVALPTSPVPAAAPGVKEISTGSRGPEPLHTVYTRYSAPMSTLGLPALSVPCGFTAEGLPVGMQLSGPPLSEPLLFHAAAAYESVAGIAGIHPELRVAEWKETV
jgi:aspartyl-tRNA(Asn)/glutamyl-tRNA(Gln) amidotransferase subunit A